MANGNGDIVQWSTLDRVVGVGVILIGLLLSLFLWTLNDKVAAFQKRFDKIESGQVVVEDKLRKEQRQVMVDHEQRIHKGATPFPMHQDLQKEVSDLKNSVIRTETIVSMMARRQGIPVPPKE